MLNADHELEETPLPSLPLGGAGARQPRFDIGLGEDFGGMSPLPSSRQPLGNISPLIPPSDLPEREADDEAPPPAFGVADEVFGDNNGDWEDKEEEIRSDTAESELDPAKEAEFMAQMSAECESYAM